MKARACNIIRIIENLNLVSIISNFKFIVIRKLLYLKNVLIVKILAQKGYKVSYAIYIFQQDWILDKWLMYLIYNLFLWKNWQNYFLSIILELHSKVLFVSLNFIHHLQIFVCPDNVCNISYGNIFIKDRCSVKSNYIIFAHIC